MRKKIDGSKASVNCPQAIVDYISTWVGLILVTNIGDTTRYGLNHVNFTGIYSGFYLKFVS